LNPSIYRAIGRTGGWSTVEDSKLKYAVQVHSGKNWDAIAALVPDRTRNQCHKRWRNALDPRIDRTNGRTGKWAEDEDIKLKDAVQMHNGKNWDAIAALVPGRTMTQCRSRWHHTKNPRIDRTNGRTGKWAEDEDIKLKDAVQTHGDKDWNAIAALIPGRTKQQCHNRWQDALDPSIDWENGRTGTWTEDEDSKLKHAVQTNDGKNWGAISALIPGRTKTQCNGRWRQALKPNIDRASGLTDA
jgi:hypothetical protein